MGWQSLLRLKSDLATEDSLVPKRRRILVLVPLITKEREAASIRKFLQTYAWDGTTIDVAGLERNPAVNSNSEATMAAVDFVRRVQQAEKDGYDAVISYCYADVGVDAARQMANIPVIGPLEASVLTGILLGRKLSIVSVGALYPPGEFYILPRLKENDLDSCCASVRGISFDEFFVFSDDSSKTERTKEALLSECKKALGEDGAHVLILACTGFPMARELRGVLGVPVIDAAITLKIAEALVDLGLSHSKVLTYKKQRTRNVVDWEAV